MDSCIQALSNRKLSKLSRLDTITVCSHRSEHDRWALDAFCNMHQTPDDDPPPEPLDEITLFPDCISYFVGLLQKTPEIIPCVTKLVLAEKPSSAEDGDRRRDVWDVRTLSLFINSLLSIDPWHMLGHPTTGSENKQIMCPNASTLVLRNWTVPPAEEAMCLLASQFCNIHTLVVDQAELGGPRTFAGLYHTFPQLTTLIVNGAQNKLKLSGVQKMTYPAFRVSMPSCLIFTYPEDTKDSFTISEMLGGLLPMPQHWDLRTLDLSRLLVDDVVYVQTLLADAGPMLEDLCIDGRAAFRSYAQDSHPLRLHDCKILHTLTIVDLPLRPDIQDDHYHDDLIAFIRGIRSPCLRVLRFHFLSAIEDADLEDSEPWRWVWQFVCGPNIKRDRKSGLRVEVVIPEVTENLKRAVTGKIPVLRHHSCSSDSRPQWRTLVKLLPGEKDI